MNRWSLLCISTSLVNIGALISISSFEAAEHQYLSTANYKYSSPIRKAFKMAPPVTY